MTLDEKRDYLRSKKWKQVLRESWTNGTKREYWYAPRDKLMIEPMSLRRAFSTQKMRDDNE